MAKRHRRKQKSGGSEPRTREGVAQTSLLDASVSGAGLKGEDPEPLARTDQAPADDAPAVESHSPANLGFAQPESNPPAPSAPVAPVVKPRSEPTRPGQPPARTLEELLAARDFEGAVPLIEVALEERPTDVELLRLAATANSALGRYGEAQVRLQQALELKPDDLRLQREMGLAFFRRGLYAEAAEALSVVCARSESDGDAYYYRGEALNRSGQPEAAAATMEKAARMSPSDGRVFRSLGRIYDRLGQSEKAAEMHGKARKVPTAGLEGG